MNLETTLRDGRSEITAKQYLARLRILNDGNDVKSLVFLKNKKTIEEKIGKRAESTRPSYYSAIIAAIGPYKSYEALRNYYRRRLDATNKSLKSQIDTHEKTDTQKESMIDSEVLRKRLTELKASLVASPSSEKEWNAYLYHLVLSLYMEMPPRRNQDYYYMYAVKKEPKTLSEDRNYYVMSKGEFIFNKYKTSKAYGTVRLPVPETLQQTLKAYLKHYNEFNGGAEVPLLAFFDGTRPHAVNGMTRLLHKAIGKKVGSTALRHIYLSEKYKDVLDAQVDMESDRKAMSHSAGVQLEYIKR